MKRVLLASVLAASTLWFSAPANAAFPPPLPKAQQSFDAGSVHVDVYGTAHKPALIFIPGLLCGPWEWAGEIERFSPGYTIYALTLPGFDGRAPIEAPLFQTVSADVWTLLQVQHIERPIIIGHSLGGTLAIMLAEQHSERMRAVIAVDGLPVFPGTESMSAAERDAAAQRFAAVVSAGKTTDALPRLISSARDVTAVAPLVARSDQKAAGAWTAEDVSLDLRAQLDRISVPLLEVAPGSAMATYYKPLLSGDSSAQVAAVENSRHFIMFDQPQALDALIAHFLVRIGG